MLVLEMPEEQIGVALWVDLDVTVKSHRVSRAPVLICTRQRNRARLTQNASSEEVHPVPPEVSGRSNPQPRWLWPAPGPGQGRWSMIAWSGRRPSLTERGKALRIS